VFLSTKGGPTPIAVALMMASLKSWYGALRRAGLDRELTPHDPRHTWASWHYALNRDLLALKHEGGWSSITLVERYAHLLPAGHDEAIRRFLGWHEAGTEPQAAQARA
jgi:integrase